MMKRRKFLATTASASAVAAATGISLPGAEADAAGETKRFSKFDYIDMHTHLGTFYYGKPLMGRHLVRMMDRHHIEKAVILPLVSPESSPYPQTTESALAFAKEHPDRLIPFCCIDPRASTVAPTRPGHVRGVKGLVDILKRYQEAGCEQFHSMPYWSAPAGLLDDPDRQEDWIDEAIEIGHATASTKRSKKKKGKNNS